MDVPTIMELVDGLRERYPGLKLQMTMDWDLIAPSARLEGNAPLQVTNVEEVNKNAGKRKADIERGEDDSIAKKKKKKRQEEDTKPSASGCDDDIPVKNEGPKDQDDDDDDDNEGGNGPSDLIKQLTNPGASVAT